MYCVVVDTELPCPQNEHVKVPMSVASDIRCFELGRLWNIHRNDDHPTFIAATKHVNRLALTGVPDDEATLAATGVWISFEDMPSENRLFDLLDQEVVVEGVKVVKVGRPGSRIAVTILTI